MSVSPLRFFVAGSGVADDDVFNALAATPFSSLESGFIRLPSSSEIFPHSEFCSEFEYQDSLVWEGSLGGVGLLARVRFLCSGTGISVSEFWGTPPRVCEDSVFSD